MRVTIDCDDEQELEYVQQCLANEADGEIGAGVDVADGHGEHMAPDSVTVTALGQPVAPTEG